MSATYGIRPNIALQPTPLRVERDPADFTCYNQQERVPDLLVAARLNAGVSPPIKV